MSEPGALVGIKWGLGQTGNKDKTVVKTTGCRLTVD
jgi:hypothetical protein